MAWTGDTLLAWAAGFYDGEGSARACRDRRDGRIAIQMSVVQVGTKTDPPDTLMRFRDAVGGVGTISRRKNTGSLGKKPQWVWRCYKTSEMRDVFAMLRPYLGMAKLDQFAEAFALRAEYEGLLADRLRFCKRGHELTERGSSTRRRRCWECHNTYAREWKRRRRARLAAGGVI